MAKRTVNYARMHDMNVVIPGFGVVPPELPSQSKSIPNLQMFYEDGVLEVQINGISCGIPSANVKFMRFAKEENTYKEE